MSGIKVLKSSQEQASAAWANHLNQLRFQDLAQRLAKQDINLEQALSELQKLKAFVAEPSFAAVFLVIKLFVIVAVPWM